MGNFLELYCVKNEHKSLDIVREKVITAKMYLPPITEKCGIRLHMNENINGPSPKCLQALKTVEMSDIYLYPYGGDKLIIDAIAKRFEVDAENIVVNTGAASMIQQIYSTILEKGDEIYLPKPGWDYYRGLAELLGARLNYYDVCEVNNLFTYDYTTITKAIGAKKPKLIIVTSPNMPTGNIMSLKDINKLCKEFSKSIILLDEAYLGFNTNYEICETKLLKDNHNIIIVRTMSKLYALASIRIGFALCNVDIADYLRKSSLLFGIPYISQLLGKVALEDIEYYKSLADEIVEIRDLFASKINSIDGMTCYQSFSNFVLIKSEKISPAKLVSYLREYNYIIRDCKGYGLNKHIRISIGKKEHMQEIAELIFKYTKKTENNILQL